MNYIESHMNHGTEYVINDGNNDKKIIQVDDKESIKDLKKTMKQIMHLT